METIKNILVSLQTSTENIDSVRANLKVLLTAGRERISNDEVDVIAHEVELLNGLVAQIDTLNQEFKKISKKD